MNMKSKKLILYYIFGDLITYPLVAINSPGDDDIRFWIKNAISEDPYIETPGIDVEVSNGIVTLSGEVKNIVSKKYADMEAKKIKGVLGVINRLAISPSNVSDSEIIQNVRRRIVDSTIIKSQNINVTCVDGKVKLKDTKVFRLSKDELLLTK